MVVREVFARLGLNVDRGSFLRGDQMLTGIKRAAATIGVTLGGAAIVRGFQRLIDNTVSLGDTMDKLSGRTGIAASTLQEFRHAAALTGVDARTADDGLQRMTRRLHEASKGYGEGLRAVEQYGIRLRDSNGEMLDAEGLLGEVTDAMSRANSEADRLTLAYNVFGRSGEDLSLTLAGGREQLEAMMQEARDLGGIMSDRLVKDSAALRDEQQRLSMVWRGMSHMLAEEVVPYLVESARGAQAWFRANRELIRQNMQRVGRGIVHAFEGVKNILWGVRQTASVLLQAVDGLTRGLGDMGKVAGRVALVLGIIAAIFGVKALAILALILIIEDFIVWLRGGESVIGELAAAWEKLIKDIWAGESNMPPFLQMLLTGLDEAVYLASTLAAALWALVTGDTDLLRGIGADIIDRYSRPVNDGRGGTLSSRVISSAPKGLQPFLERTLGVRGVEQIDAPGGHADPLGGAIDDPLSLWRARGGMMAGVSAPRGDTIIEQSIDLDINVPPGTDAQGVARAVREELGEWTRGAFRDLVPEAP